ncbi:MAG: bifunctional UDP-N-acetylglucosamine diphosphorylase/glucosamine-1-phosphate N-acetyltransferase GlmU, partial [Planctomycetes bacterium]|nr:bifunctional UDP-N-acetylglucosamine diphosphorylase/glucosamine-1-phosphate N-acetyltransferase GlmU [Planctomycetota bacterium]
KAFAGAADVVWVEQTEQLGTGHAVMVCGEHLTGLDGPVLVVAGDGPLVRGETLAELLGAHTRAGAACTLATCILDDPKAYGRILRDDAGELIGIVEYLDADEAQRAVSEVNVSLYCYDARRLREALGRLTNDNAKGEYYITDTLALLRADGHRLAAVPAVPPQDVLSINDRVQLAQVNALMQQRTVERLMLAGVTVEQPATVWIDPRVEIGPDTVVRPNTVLDGPCRIGRGCVIGPFVHLAAAVIGDGAVVKRGNGQ